MGMSLIAGARRLSADNLAWRREWARAAGRDESSGQNGRSLTFIYWAAGALIVGAGLGILSAGQPVVSGPTHSRLTGFLIAAIGVGAGTLKLIARSRAPRFIENEPGVGESRMLGERVAEIATWTLCSLWAAFGCALAMGYWR